MRISLCLSLMLCAAGPAFATEIIQLPTLAQDPSASPWTAGFEAGGLTTSGIGANSFSAPIGGGWKLEVSGTNGAALPQFGFALPSAGFTGSQTKLSYDMGSFKPFVFSGLSSGPASAFGAAPLLNPQFAASPFSRNSVTAGFGADYQLGANSSIGFAVGVSTSQTQTMP